MGEKSAIFFCMEERTNPAYCLAMANFIRSLGRSTYLVTRAGGVQDVVRPPQPVFREVVLRDFRVAIKHGAKKIFIGNHADCKAYPEFSSPQEELAFHQADLRQASKILSAEFNGLAFAPFFVPLLPGSREVFGQPLMIS